MSITDEKAVKDEKHTIQESFVKPSFAKPK